MATRPVVLATRVRNQKQNQDETEYRKNLSEQKRQLEKENDEFHYRNEAERYAYEQALQNVSDRKRKAN